MARHRETVFPFSTIDRVLADCVLAPDLPDDSARGKDSWITTPADIESGLAFGLELDCDWESIPNRTNWRLEDLILNVRFRNEGQKRAESIRSWPADDIPSDAQFRRLQTGLNFQIDVSLVNARHLRRSSAPDVFPGTVVANRRFTFTASGFRFPMEYANFAEHGWPPDALWHIEFDPDVESVDAPADECMEVFINEKLRHIFEGKTPSKRAAVATFTHVTGPLIFAEVAKTALRRGLIGEQTSTGLADAIVSTLTGDGKHRIEEWTAWAIDASRQDEFTSKIVSILSAAENLRGV